MRFAVWMAVVAALFAERAFATKSLASITAWPVDAASLWFLAIRATSRVRDKLLTKPLSNSTTWAASVSLLKTNTA